MKKKSSVSISSYVLSALFVVFALAQLHPCSAFGQGFLIDPIAPRPLPRWVVRPIPPTVEPTSYSIESLEIGATINNGVAKVDVSQTFKNTGNSTIETSFVFPLPYDGAIDAMTLLVNGKEFPAQLLDAKEAKATYEAIVRKSKDPALLEWVGSGLFKTSVFPIPAGETRTVTISYSQILRVSGGLTEFFFPMSCAQYTSKPIGKTSFDLTIVGDSELKNIYAPAYDLKIERNGKNVAKVSYVAENKNLGSDFRLFYDQSADDLDAKIQSYRPVDAEDGYFLMLAAPKIVDNETESLSKTIVFALDVSGSMMGRKIEQARDSLKFVVERLRDGDKFNIILFSNDAKVYKPELQVASAETRADALAYVSAVRATGGTNIESALKLGGEQLSKDDSNAPKYFVFISDGEPTVGECNEMKLAQIARESNKSGARVHTFGVGYDVHSRLLDRFTRDGRGVGEYVKPEESIEASVSKFYGHIQDPVFSNVTFQFTLKDAREQQYVTNLVYPSDSMDVFAGEQIVLVGRYSTPGDVTVTAKGKIGEKEVEFTFAGNFVAKSDDASFSYVERLWAARRVGELVDQLDLNGSNPELMKELLELAKKHGILTPYTSFLADDNVVLNASSNIGVASRNFDSMASQTSNASAFAQRSLKQNYRSAQNLDVDSSVSESMELAMQAPPQEANSFGSMGGGTRGRAAAARGVMRSAPRLMDAPARAVTRATSNSEAKVSVVAGKTFYFKEGRWIDSSIDEKMEQTQKPIEIKRFSDDYFELVNANGKNLSQYLVFVEPITLNYNGQIYKIDPED